MMNLSVHPCRAFFPVSSKTFVTNDLPILLSRLPHQGSAADSKQRTRAEVLERALANAAQEGQELLHEVRVAPEIFLGVALLLA